MPADHSSNLASTPRWARRHVWAITLLVIAAAVLGYPAYVRYINRPRVILDSHLITPIAAPGTALSDRVEAPELYGGITNTTDAHPIVWNGRPVKIDGVDEHIMITDPMTGSPVASTDLREFYSIGRMRAVPVCRQSDGTDLLAVLVALRPTSHRSLLLVYAGDGRLVYEELLERRSGPSADRLFAGRLNNENALMVDLQGVISGWTCQH